MRDAERQHPNIPFGLLPLGRDDADWAFEGEEMGYKREVFNWEYDRNHICSASELNERLKSHASLMADMTAERMMQVGCFRFKLCGKGVPLDITVADCESRSAHEWFDFGVSRRQAEHFLKLLMEQFDALGHTDLFFERGYEAHFTIREGVFSATGNRVLPTDKRFWIYACLEIAQ